MSVQVHDDLAPGGHGWTPVQVTIDEDPYRLGPPASVALPQHRARRWPTR
jgi:hypothetical protein